MDDDFRAALLRVIRDPTATMGVRQLALDTLRWLNKAQPSSQEPARSEQAAA